MKKSEFESRLSAIKEQEEKLGVKIEIYDIIDKDHLDCTWYGGEVGIIKMPDGYIVTIGAYGDICLSGVINGSEVYIKDKNNGGTVYSELGKKLNDDRLRALLGKSTKRDWLVLESNNWFEVDVISPTGEWIDLSGADNVLDDCLLSCFENVEDYFEYVEWAKHELSRSIIRTAE